MATQTKTATFTGAEPYVDLTWDTHYTSFRLIPGAPATTDGSAPAIRVTNPSNPAIAPINTGVRVEPSAPFSGTVSVLCIEVP